MDERDLSHMAQGRHFSPSLAEHRYLRLSPQKRSLGRNLGEHRSKLPKRLVLSVNFNVKETKQMKIHVAIFGHSARSVIAPNGRKWSI